MEYIVSSKQPGVLWEITEEGRPIGIVERLSTGYLVSIPEQSSPDRKIKRFRMIDALREALGESVRITLIPEG